MNHYICKNSYVKQNCLVIYSKITKQNTTRCEERKSNYYAHIYIETSIKIRGIWKNTDILQRNNAETTAITWFKKWLLPLPYFAKVKVKFYFYE